MLTSEKYQFIKDKYGLHASWAVWTEVGDKPKSNMDDLSIFDDPEIVTQLNPDVVLVALNMSVSDVVRNDFQNFHWTGGNDYKIRYALKNTSGWGAYMTDIIKDFPEKKSGNMMSYLRKNRWFEEENAKKFRAELDDLGTTNPTLIAFGNDVFNILNRSFRGKFRILKVPHYAVYMSKENYREVVTDVIS